jgi:hypothetical protein
MAQPGFRFETDVSSEGTVTLKLPLPPGTPVEVVVLGPESDDYSDLVQAATTSTDFWDNPWDDEDWNNAPTR